MHEIKVKGKRRVLEQQTVTLFVSCLERVSERLNRLKESDREVFFSEVKNLIKIIKWTQER